MMFVKADLQHACKTDNKSHFETQRLMECSNCTVMEV